MFELTETTLANEAANLEAELRALKDAVAVEGAAILSRLEDDTPLEGAYRQRVENLCHYLALRRHDIRPLQRRLMVLGLSSLGRLESRVMPTLEATLNALSAINGTSTEKQPYDSALFFAGETALIQAADELFGAPRASRRGRIMVTMPSTAADDTNFVSDLVARGMDIARINCAHDDKECWNKIAENVRAAANAAGRPVKILMDIAGPKIRTEDVLMQKKARLKRGDLLRLVAEGEPHLADDVKASARASLPEIVTRLELGHRIRYDDGKLEGEAIATGQNEVIVKVTHAKAGGVKLKPEKGLNLPDTALGLSPLTSKDKSDLEAVSVIADMIGYSFVSEPKDIPLLDEALAEIGYLGAPLGLVAKIEQPQALRNLPALILEARRQNRPFAVMIARGDLAAEIGFERLAEMQEEILWICEAASIPVIWATQVLEDLVKTGLPSRGEMTDAAMASRAECVMLNKGPAVGEAVTLLDTLLARMDGHVFKKTPTLRALHTWE
ncbi:pyruvate kinase [Rhizobium sp. L1K21]|uniref:pyruvate kinase n=1 Tax=Rhizobium sp. L1K21 TaxID=2954933 RepID=UPI002093D770|nr:pyruvate kinase [Rhizobium sp. L1K21]MCO6185343.1 pyruvate kinase [Rhizobium sp. L1K21]